MPRYTGPTDGPCLPTCDRLAWRRSMSIAPAVIKHRLTCPICRRPGGAGCQA